LLVNVFSRNFEGAGGQAIVVAMITANDWQ
jgi:hypothetical protein